MDSYDAARDGWDVPVRPSTTSQRRRSQSPNSRNPRDHASDPRIDRDRHLARRDRLDYDAPPQLLSRKQNGPSVSIPSAPASSHASTSRHALPDRPAPSAPRRNSAAAEVRSEILRRLLADPVERNLFDKIEAKRYSIGEIRRERSEELKKIDTCQKYLDSDKAAQRDTILTRLRGHQEKKAELERQIKSENDELYRMQLEWQLDVSELCMPALLAAAQAPIEHRLDDFHSQMRSDRAQDKERIDDIESRTRIVSGQTDRLQSDMAKVKREIGNNAREIDRLATKVDQTSKELRRDIDKDVIQISDNDNRIKVLTQGVASLKSQVSKVASSVVSNTYRANSTTPPSRGNVSKPRAPSPALDPRRPPQQATSSDTASTSSAATAPANNGVSSANVAEARTARTSGEQVVTRPILAKWLRGFNQDLELRFDEIKDLAVQEATAENQACMEERLAALLQKYKRKAARGDGQCGQQGTAAGADGADGTVPTPMDVEPAGATDATAVTQTSTVAGASKAPERPLSPPDVDVVEVVPAPAGAHKPDSLTSSSTPASSAAAAPNHLDSVQAKPVPDSAEPEAAKSTVAAVPTSVLETLRNMLKKHATEIEAISKDQTDTFGQLLVSPEKLNQLFSALKTTGLGKFLDSVASTVPQLQESVNRIQAALTSLESRLGEHVKALEDHKSEMIHSTDSKVDWLQRQLEVLEDQSSLQGALLVKLSEHANPRRPPPSLTSKQQQQSQQQSHPNRSALVQQLVNPPAHLLSRQQAVSAQQQMVHQHQIPQVQQPQQQHAQQVQYMRAAPPNPGLDPNQRRGL